MEPQFNISGLIRSLGRPAELRDRFRAIGLEPPPTNTIIGWRRRNSCPGQWLAALLDIARRDPAMPELDEVIDLMAGGDEQ